jgi:hypothetical protein
MKSNNNLFCGLLIFLFILSVCLLCAKNKLKQVYNSNTNSNDLRNAINNNENILIMENFQNSLNSFDNAIESLETENHPEKETVTASNVNFQQGEDADIEDLLDQLDTMEEKCRVYETNEREKLDKEHAYLKQKYREQLEIENDKIEQLKDLVNYYRKRYYKKLKINNDCRKKIQGRLDEDTDFIKDIGGLAEDHQPKFNINKKELIDKIVN